MKFYSPEISLKRYLVLEWLTDDENRELADEIEAVNDKMLEKLIRQSPFLAVFFCEFLP